MFREHKILYISKSTLSIQLPKDSTINNKPKTKSWKLIKLTSYSHSPWFTDSGESFIFVLGAWEVLPLLTPFLNRWRQKGITCIFIKCQYLGPLAMNQRNKDTFLSQTMKVEENKVSSFFLFMAEEPRYGHFIV